MKKINRFSTLLASLMLLTTVAACGGGNDGSKPNKSNDPGNGRGAVTNVIDKNESGEITVMVWAGDDQYHEDIGHAEWAPNEISGHNTAMIYGIAKEYN